MTGAEKRNQISRTRAERKMEGGDVWLLLLSLSLSPSGDGFSFSIASISLPSGLPLLLQKENDDGRGELRNFSSPTLEEMTFRAKNQVSKLKSMVKHKR